VLEGRNIDNSEAAHEKRTKWQLSS
jgi:hypothetical protein